MFGLQIVYYKLKSIITGWYAFLFKSKSEMAHKRLSICRSCPYRYQYFCGLCGCVLEAKAESPDEKCPKDYW